MARMTDIYDEMEPNIGRQLRRRNSERLAELESQTAKRRERIRRAVRHFGGENPGGLANHGR